MVLLSLHFSSLLLMLHLMARILPLHLLPFPFLLLSVPRSFTLYSPSSPLPLPSLSPRTLWYADMQEFLGLKMIDQTCQPWLLLLKMAAWQCVCRRLVRV